MGKPAKEVWPEIWKDIEPQFAKAFSGKPGGSKDALLPMHRHGYTEECYFDFTFTPVYGEGGKVEGVFNAVIETTKTILIGMRYLGHRWLHSPQSLAHMAAMCGFERIRRRVRRRLSNRSTASTFAAKRIRCRLRTFDAGRFIATRSSTPARSMAPAMWRCSTGHRAIRRNEGPADRQYPLAQPLAAEAFACLNIRSANLSSFHEHNLKWLVIDGNRPTTRGTSTRR